MARNRWDERYDQDEFVYGTEPNTFLKEQVEALFRSGNGKTKTALCLADGEGRNGVFLARSGFEVTSVDNSSVGLEKAEKLAEDNGVSITTVCADLAEYDIGEQKWNLIVSIFCHVPPQIRKKLHVTIHKALKPGGIFLLEAYTPHQLGRETGGPPTVDLMMDIPLLKSELTGLTFSLLQELERDITEGSLHTGIGAVVQAICRNMLFQE